MNFFYNPYRQFNERINQLADTSDHHCVRLNCAELFKNNASRRLDQLEAQVADMVKSSASAETVRWLVDQMAILNERVSKSEKGGPKDKTIQQHGEKIANLAAKVAALETPEAIIDAAAERWGAGTIENLQKRVAELEQRTQPPAGLEPEAPRRTSGGAKWKGTTTPGTKTDDVMKACHALCMAYDGRAELGQVASWAKMPRAETARILSRLHRNGLVRRVGRGVYALPEHTHAAHPSRILAGQNGRG